MVAHSTSNELIALRKRAEQLADQKGHRVSTAHLLAAVAAAGGEATDLLLERRLDVDVLMHAARVLVDDDNKAVERAISKARELSMATSPSATAPLRLLFALCQGQGTAAQRALEQCGVDAARLRMATMQIAAGVMPPRRQPARAVTENASRLALPDAPSKRPQPTPRTTTRAPVPQPEAPPSHTRTPVARPTHARPSAPPPRHDAARKKKSRDVRPSQAGAQFALDPKQYPLLTTLGRNLTEAAAKGQLDPVVGREAEIERTLDVLAKRHASNACLVGPSGVGKKSIVRAIAQRIADGVDVACFEDRVLVEISPAGLLAGTGVRGSLAERVAQLRQEIARADGRVLLFFDELQLLFGEGSDEGSVELTGALSRGELRCIGTTTEGEYKRVLDTDATLSRCFTAIEVAEMSQEEALLAVEATSPLFEKHHACSYEDLALARAITFSARFLPGRALPDKAIQVLDLAGARARRRGESVIGVEQVAEVLSEMCGVPEDRLLETDGARLLRLEELLGERIVGHSDAIERISRVLRRNAGGFRSQRPIGTFLLLGPTGVGKTETAKAIAQCLFHSGDAMTRLDLSEYSEAHAISRLVGAPPGYVGFDAGGQLTEVVRRRPYQVVLLDEIEKAHRDVLEGFLQVFDEGRLTDGRGRTVDFTNTVIILTSNIGADVSVRRERARIGFGQPAEGARAKEIADYQEAVTDAARRELPPELYNRLDEVLAFAPLSRADVGEVARRILTRLAHDLAESRGIDLEVSDDAIEALLDNGGYDETLGARPMRRAIGRQVEAPIAEMVLRGQISRGDVALVDVRDGQIVVDAVSRGARASCAE
ncbi:MAG: AAA family ATPase [Myxococcales bacterium]|nr:AAA family ATPase [Myxococcales bacterium]